MVIRLSSGAGVPTGRRDGGGSAHALMAVHDEGPDRLAMESDEPPDSAGMLRLLRNVTLLGRNIIKLL
jgi:hypothetical protein